MLKTLKRYKFTLAYLVAILLVCILFNWWPLIWELKPGLSISPWTALVGFWFVLRDYTQREIGPRKVFIPMSIGVAITILLNWKFALAEAITGVVGELTDWAVYTYTQKPFYQRVVVSSAVSAVVDTVTFFALFDYLQIVPGVSIFNWATVTLAIGSKMLAALYILWLYRKDVKRSLR